MISPHPFGARRNLTLLARVRDEFFNRMQFETVIQRIYLYEGNLCLTDWETADHWERDGVWRELLPVASFCRRRVT